MARARRSNAERSRETRGALVSAARRAFEERGFAGASADDIARRAGLTRGAMYHHFRDKRELYGAVIEEIQQELAEHVDRTAEKEADPWEAFVAGWLSFLEVATRPGIRLLMLEGPAVIGYEEWRAIDDRHFLPPVVDALDYLMRRGVVATQPVEPLARVLLTISNALGTLVVQHQDPEAAKAEVAPVWAHLLSSLRAP